MRRIMLGLAVLGGFSAFAAPGRAQIPNNLNDPFYQYYSFFLPRQAAIASQPKVTDSINAIAAARAESSTIDRSGLYGGASPFGLDSLDPTSPNKARAGYNRPSRAANSITSSNIRGGGDPRYFGRVTNFLGAKTGVQAPAPRVARRGGGGMGGMGGMGMPSPTGGMGGFSGR